MPTIDTELFSMEAPELFEKALQMGQLVRLERLDRAAGEASFAEVNFFVGNVREEDPPFPPDGPADVVLEGLWDQYLEQERWSAPVTGDSIIEEERTPKSRRALVKLEATSFRPVTGQLVWIFLPDRPEGSGDWTFARLVLEFDWNQRATYEPLGRSILDSLHWKQAAISAEGIAIQETGAWSIFDEMDPARREAIMQRYRSILAQLSPEPVAKEQVQTLDLRELDPEQVTVALLEAKMPKDDDDTRVVVLQVAFLSDPVEFTCHEEDDDGHQFGEETVAMLRALQSLSAKDQARAGGLMWEHCQVEFEATDYGAPEGQSNEDFFGIHGPEEAFAQAGKATVYIDESIPGGAHDVFALDFYPPWEQEHGCSLVIRDGQLVGWSNPGGWLGEFAPEDKDDA